MQQVQHTAALLRPAPLSKQLMPRAGSPRRRWRTAEYILSEHVERHTPRSARHCGGQQEATPALRTLPFPVSKLCRFQPQNPLGIVPNFFSNVASVSSTGRPLSLKAVALMRRQSKYSHSEHRSAMPHMLAHSSTCAAVTVTRHAHFIRRETNVAKVLENSPEMQAQYNASCIVT